MLGRRAGSRVGAEPWEEVARAGFARFREAAGAGERRAGGARICTGLRRCGQEGVGKSPGATATRKRGGGGRSGQGSVQMQRGLGSEEAGRTPRIQDSEGRATVALGSAVPRGDPDPRPVSRPGGGGVRLRLGLETRLQQHPVRLTKGQQCACAAWEGAGRGPGSTPKPEGLGLPPALEIPRPRPRS